MPKYKVGFEWEEMRDSAPVEAPNDIECATRFACSHEDGEDSVSVFVCDATASETFNRYEIAFDRKVEARVLSGKRLKR